VLFSRLVSGKLSGANAKSLLMQSGLPNSDLKLLWNLSDIDRDGSLDVDEFVLCSYLIEQIRTRPDFKLPAQLDMTYVPPSKREIWLNSNSGSSAQMAPPAAGSPGGPKPPARPARG